MTLMRRILNAILSLIQNKLPNFGNGENYDIIQLSGNNKQHTT
jgi:hypothetical protein